MSRVPSNDSDDDFAVEITSLDAPEASTHRRDLLLQGSRLTPRVRILLTILSVLGGLLLIVIVLSPVLSSLLPKQTSTSPAIHPPVQIQNITAQSGIAYITSSDGTLRALRMSNGSLLWQRYLGDITPLFVQNTIYIYDYSNQKSTVQALRASDGTVRWTFKASSDISPLIIDNGVVYPLFQSSSQAHLLTALDGRNGAERWVYVMNISQAQYIYTQAMQDNIYITVWANSQTANMELFVLNIADGSLLWHTKAAGMQLIHNNLVCITTAENVLHVLRADNGHEIWHYKSPKGANLPSITGENLLYIQTPEGSLQALRADNGALRWTYKDPWGVAEVFSEANGVLYLETGDGFIVALRASDGTRLWHVRPIPPPFTFGSIQVEDGIVYTFTAVGEAQDVTIAALHASDGSILWKRNIGTSDIMSIPITNGQLLADSGRSITVLRAHDGVVLWHANYTQTTSPYNSGFLALEDDVMILRSSNSVLEAHQAETGAVLWRYRAASS